MENLLRNIEGISILLDDIRIAGRTIAELLHRLELVLQRLHNHNIKINIEKCEFFKDEVEYCGFVINANGINKSSKKINVIENMPRPTNLTEVRAFIGLINYYNRFIENASQILRSLYLLLCKTKEFVWTNECENAFITAKRAFRVINV